MTLDEILKLVHNDGMCRSANKDIVGGHYMSPQDALVDIQEAIERIIGEDTEPPFKSLNGPIENELRYQQRQRLKEWLEVKEDDD